MNPPTHILVATDFSEGADAAFDYAVVLARALEARVTVLHVYELHTFAYDVAFPADLEHDLRDAAIRAMRILLESRPGPGIPLASLVKKGDWRVIDSTAEEIGADWIVVGTHGRHGLARAMLGSVAERIVRTSTRPVLTVHRV